MTTTLSGARAACFSFAVYLALGAAGGDARAQAIGPSAAPFGSWTALGSGCRGGAAGEDASGDVTQAILPTADPGAWRARYDLSAFRLDTGERPPGAPLTFARECGIRVVVTPPAGMRIALIASEARVVGRKSSGAKLTMTADLALGGGLLARRRAVHPPTGAWSGEEGFTLAPGTDAPMPSLGCGEARIAALDLTWIVGREGASESARVEMGGGGGVDLEVRFEPCGPGRK
jgi:hypothetical protein